MAGFLVVIPALLFSILVLSEIMPVVPYLEDSQTVCRDQKNDLICELQEMKLKIAQLESIMEKSIGSLNTKSHYLEEKGKLSEEMTHNIHLLQSALINIKGESTYTEEMLNALEEEVRLLWAASRKNNFDLHILESKAQEAEVRQEMVTSQVEKMENILTEQWIQIRQLEQALQVTEMRTLKAQKKAGPTRCTLLKFIKDISGHHLPKVSGFLDPHLFGKESILCSYMSQALHQFKRIMSAAQKYHHELQGFVKQEMKRNEFTAALANQEVVFFVASALITFPILSAWMLLLSNFS